MRMTMNVMLAGTAVATVLAGCGGGKQFANNPRPPAPIDLTVYINDSHVSVSPRSLGAGPIIFIVTNQSSHSESLQVRSAGGASGQPVETGPINPQATATVKANLQPGDYIVGTTGGTQARDGSGIQPASLHLGKSRPSADNLLLQP